MHHFFCLGTIDACKVILSFLCHNKVPQKSLHANFGFLWKINDVSFLFVSGGSSPRLMLQTSVSFAKVPDFLSELPPTGAFPPLAVLPLPGVLPPPSPPPHRHSVSLLHITFSLSNVSDCVPSLWVLPDSGGIVGINGLFNKK